MFMRRGARVITAPMIRIDLMADDPELRRASDHCMAAPADIAVITTGIGFRKWVEAADGWGKREGLLAWLSRTELVARGPKVRGAVRAAGLVEAWAPASEAMAEVGAEVVTVPVYQLATPTDAVSVERLIRSIITGHVDCVVFTSAPAVVSMLDAGRSLGVHDELLKAFATTVSAACVGPICAAPFAAAGVSRRRPDSLDSFGRSGKNCPGSGVGISRLPAMILRSGATPWCSTTNQLPFRPHRWPSSERWRSSPVRCSPGRNSRIAFPAKSREAMPWRWLSPACDRCFASRGLCRQSSSAATGCVPIYRDRLSSRSTRVQQGVGSKSGSAVVVVVDGTDDPKPEAPPVDGVLPPDPDTVVVVVGGLPSGPGGGVTTGSGA